VSGCPHRRSLATTPDVQPDCALHTSTATGNPQTDVDFKEDSAMETSVPPVLTSPPLNVVHGESDGCKGEQGCQVGRQVATTQAGYGGVSAPVVMAQWNVTNSGSTSDTTTTLAVPGPTKVNKATQFEAKYLPMPDDPGSVRMGEVSPTMKGIRAKDAQGKSHRGQEWTGSRCFVGEGSPICVVREGQKQWLANHSDQTLKWAYPTKQRECLRVAFRAAEKTESLLSTEFRMAFGELVHSYPPTVVRIICHLYLNYWHPHNKRIQAQGRHLIMLKVYEGKNEAHCWHMPLKEVVELHRTSADSMSGGVSLNDVQLVQTYVVENTLALHVETFESDPIRRGNSYGTRTWVGGMAIHMITEETEGPAVERSQEFAMMPTEQRGDFTEKRGKIRERRERKKANEQKKKEEESIAKEERTKQEREEQEAARALQRKDNLKKPHESLTRMLKSGNITLNDDDFNEEAPLTEEELALFAVPRHREGLLQPHPSLSKLLSDKAARATYNG